jgi:hypothetical protein
MSAITFAKGSDHTLDITGLGDLTSCVVHLAVRDETGTVVIEKATAVGADGLIVAPAGTSGTARIYFVPADTADLDVGGTYFYDAWKVAADSKHYQIVGVEAFNITDRVVVLP